jgi:DNA-directed RNA polymerase specialized sigma24 family protein
MVLHYYLRGFTSDEIARVANDSARTIRPDIEALKTRLAERVAVADLYNLKRAFAELDEEWRSVTSLPTSTRHNGH